MKLKPFTPIPEAVHRGVTRTILGGFTKRNVSLGESVGMLPKKNFENYDSTSVNNSGLFFDIL